VTKKFPIKPAFPERICWGCDKYCPAHDLARGNGSERRQHPIELSGEDWYKEWGIEVTGPDAKNFDPSEHGYSKNKNTR